MSEASGDRFEQVVTEARAIKEEYVDPSLKWYSEHYRYPFVMFRGAGILTILCSASLPALATASDLPKYLLPLISIAVAALTGLSAFYRWERTWRGRSTAKSALEQLCAKWELELTNARLVLAQDEDRIGHVYKATDDLLTNVRSLLSAETEGFFSNMQFPQSNRASK